MEVDLLVFQWKLCRFHFSCLNVSIYVIMHTYHVNLVLNTTLYIVRTF